MNKQPLLILVICFVLGIFFQEQVSMGKAYIYWVIGSFILVLIAVFFQSYFLHRIRSFLLGILFFVSGILLHSFNTRVFKDIPVPAGKTVVFRISKKLNSTEKHKKYMAVIQLDKEYLNSVVFLPENSPELDFIHYYKAEAYLVRPKSPKYDFQFDYAKYLRRGDVGYQCYISGQVTSVRRNDMAFNDVILQKRFEVLQKIDHAGISRQSTSFLKGIILADRTEMDPETVKDFNRSGLVHFLAISGTHIVIIFGLFYFFLTRFLPLKFRKYTVILSLILIWLFAGFIGFGNSVLRSCIMLSVYFVYVLLQRKPDLLHSLSLSAFIILMPDTHQLFDVGFQLSFAAVLGIFWLNQPILKYLPDQDNYFKKLIFNTVSISISAQLGTLPLVLYYFHQFSFISIVANFFIVPFSEVIIIFSFLMTALIAFDLDFHLISVVYDFIIKILLKSIHWFAGFDGLFFENIPLNLTEVFALSAIIYWLRFVIVKINFKNIGRLGIAVLVFFIIRAGFNIVEDRKEETLLHDFYKDKVFSVKRKDEACFWVSENADKEKIVRYIVNPYAASRRLRKTEIRTFSPSIQKVVYQGKIYEIN
ncbi:competence protein ComEC [Chryseobacterium defluvii]|uniref:Competence protein ComEC n=1 Tax=Chryseobacterium defluvii TaxID=160396 RepID=A0A840KDH5_9FLAO|nr:ComEC/Rec2 family competence protein [Chryseobacterium defluvii]MBB4807569.1 competence protein ComEC [Chryseobacterium defluvii]